MVSILLLLPDFYHFHHVIWGMKWAKKLKTKNGQNMSSGPFSHAAAHIEEANHNWTFQGQGRVPFFYQTFIRIRLINFGSLVWI